MESQEKRDREGNLLAFLQSDDLVSCSVEKLTVEVLKGAVVTCTLTLTFLTFYAGDQGGRDTRRQFEELHGQ